MGLLITGAGGFLGSALCRQALRSGHAVTGSFLTSMPPDGVEAIRADLRGRDEIIRLLDRTAPDAVIHAAALPAPNTCETQPKNSRRINVDAPAILARECAKRKIHFAFISTDLVFSGEHAPYPEEARPHPLNTYGRHKLEAERTVLADHPACQVFRLPLLLGRSLPGRTNFFHSIAAALREEREIALFEDEFRTPAEVGVVATGIISLLGKSVGIIHLGGPQRVSRLELGLMATKILAVQASAIKACRRSDIAMPAPRPRDVSLLSAKAEALGFSQPPLEAQLAQILLGQPSGTHGLHPEHEASSS